MGVLDNHEKKVVETIERIDHVESVRGLRCHNHNCHLYGIMLEIDEIDVAFGDVDHGAPAQVLCASCLQPLGPWPDVALDSSTEQVAA